jgi:hypothetical protein
MKNVLVSGCVGLGLLVAPLAFAQNQQKPNVDADVQRAIQWEHYKDAAAARQAAIERQHSTIHEAAPRVSTSSSAEREDVNGYARQPMSQFRTEPTASELAAAVAWEHQKDAAAARQAATERHGSHTDNGSK